MMFLVSVTWLRAYAMLAYGFSKVPAFTSFPSVDTTSNLEVSITLISNSALPGVAVSVTVPTMEGGLNLAEASLSSMVTVTGLIFPSLTLKSKLYDGIDSSRAKVSDPSVPINFTVISAVVPIYTGSLLQDMSTTVQWDALSGCDISLFVGLLLLPK